MPKCSASSCDFCELELRFRATTGVRKLKRCGFAFAFGRPLSPRTLRELRKWPGIVEKAHECIKLIRALAQDILRAAPAQNQCHSSLSQKKPARASHALVVGFRRMFEASICVGGPFPQAPALPSPPSPFRYSPHPLGFFFFRRCCGRGAA